MINLRRPSRGSGLSAADRLEEGIGLANRWPGNIPGTRVLSLRAEVPEMASGRFTPLNRSEWLEVAVRVCARSRVCACVCMCSGRGGRQGVSEVGEEGTSEEGSVRLIDSRCEIAQSKLVESCLLRPTELSQLLRLDSEPGLGVRLQSEAGVRLWVRAEQRTQVPRSVRRSTDLSRI